MKKFDSIPAPGTNKHYLMEKVENGTSPPLSITQGLTKLEDFQRQMSPDLIDRLEKVELHIYLKQSSKK